MWRETEARERCVAELPNMVDDAPGRGISACSNWLTSASQNSQLQTKTNLFKFLLPSLKMSTSIMTLMPCNSPPGPPTHPAIPLENPRPHSQPHLLFLDRRSSEARLPRTLRANTTFRTCEGRTAATSDLQGIHFVIHLDRLLVTHPVFPITKRAQSS
ncbi:hypothetical protein E2C01_096095 [Portunus trituberculatus]|uniref:Uncharacterized protein n=1 Tax=Portunus trituberculatus TaxID=210409 RepID=A0A5B7JX37_PORTR|nr:hypothetical protein [Portunus trituberculatus]